MCQARLLAAIVAVVFLLPTAAPAQDIHRCGYDDYVRALTLKDPEFATRRQEIEQHTQAFAASGTRSGSTIHRIPVVVHVVYSQSQQNLSGAVIQTQIDVLNEDFRRLNADAINTRPQFVGVAADCEIEFCLATVDPMGLPTTGITRTSTTVGTFNPFTDNVKRTASGGRDPWPAADYLNIWTCNMSQGLLGYATPPGTPANLDGVVIAWGQFGRPGQNPILPSLNQGRTTTHEVGHYLNLLHVWGNNGGCFDDDQVADTPNCNGPSTGCPLNRSTCSSLDMVENYMDYSDDVCMNTFTQGQRTRMRAVLAPNGSRVSLLTSPAACPPPGPQYQTNSFNASLDINGVVGTPTTAATLTIPTGNPITLTLFSFNTGQSWELGYGTSPLVGASSGVFTSSDGQFVNLDLTDPTAGVWWNYFQSPPFISTTIPFTPTVPLTLSLQMIVFAPSLPSGIGISQPNRLIVQ
jgi:hypothetical protein